ncbi:AAA family ATPase [Bradyrhizobium sp. CCBAU 11361]|uniref:AAA family ATPase n=1 Tax=Bradyrhizobium sp. CCBAU 11361 TaxID=1630812 RepID=UPI002304E9AD|nr:AAA family ATPase [Bradyrhizobium sp. CCBAU 11361]
MDIDIDGKKLSNLSKINVLLGKNGAGKSSLLRHFDERKRQLPEFGQGRYITPERGGQLIYQGNIETNMLQDPTCSTRRSNRYDNFRQMSVTEFRRLETLVLRKIEQDPIARYNAAFTFETVLVSINELLDNVCVVRTTDTGFAIRGKTTDTARDPVTLSSGESELVSLGIEILAFSYTADSTPEKNSYLFLDEPDVHLHPDLQARLVKLLTRAVADRNITVVIATHSTAILGALREHKDARVGFLQYGQSETDFVEIGESLQRVLPIFGAHPLSNIFNQTPILLVEGEDDERIWQQATRSSQSKLLIWPCSAGDIQTLDQYENEVESIAGAIYDNAKAFSLRDRDDHPYEIDDKAIVKRMRLYCRAAENLLLSDDVLASLDTDWPKMIEAMNDWLVKFESHPQRDVMNRFKQSNYDRLQSDVKPLRNIFMMLAGSQKPWEVAVGQAIAGLLSGPPKEGDHSLTRYLGPKLINFLDLRFRRRFGSSRTSRYALNARPK